MAIIKPRSTITIENKYIVRASYNPVTKEFEDGVSLRDGNHYIIRNCIIDLSGQHLNEMDEAIGITWGCSADIENCVIRGAGKLILCGCGDTDKIPIETGKIVTFKHCILEDFSRRGPEVQDGMVVKLEQCLIQNWGNPDRFSVRSFASWAHGQNSFIYANSCIFKQDSFFKGNFFKDFIGHFGQAINDSGILGLFYKEAWQPGVCKGLVATDKGRVQAQNCYKNKWWISIENHSNPMKYTDYLILEANLNEMRDSLYAKLGNTNNK